MYFGKIPGVCSLIVSISAKVLVLYELSTLKFTSHSRAVEIGKIWRTPHFQPGAHEVANWDYFVYIEICAVCNLHVQVITINLDAYTRQRCPKAC